MIVVISLSRPTTPTAGRTARRAGRGIDVLRFVASEGLPEHFDRLDRVGQALEGQLPERPALVAIAPAGRYPNHCVARI